MDTRIDEISDGIYRLSTHVPDVGGPPGMTFNQFLVDAEEPLLFHAGHRNMYPLVSAAVARIQGSFASYANEPARRQGGK